MVCGLELNRTKKRKNICFVEDTKTEIDIEENIWRREIFFAEEKQIIEGKEGKYLEKDKILSVEERRHGEGK